MVVEWSDCIDEMVEFVWECIGGWIGVMFVYLFGNLFEVGDDLEFFDVDFLF